MHFSTFGLYLPKLFNISTLPCDQKSSSPNRNFKAKAVIRFQTSWCKKEGKERDEGRRTKNLSLQGDKRVVVEG